MRPYRTLRFTEHPDVGDIISEGRKSGVGRLGNGHGYLRDPEKKAAIRRTLKRRDRANLQKEREE